MKIRYIPIHLGCCPDEPRCLLCAPPSPPGADTIRALVEAAEGPKVVRFFGGAPPTDDQLAAIHGAPFEVRVRPDLLDRAGAARLIAAGCAAIELDALTFVDAALSASGRRYRAARVVAMSAALRDLGVSVGGVLAPGLPGTDHASCLADATKAAGLWSFVRLHPVQVLADSGLRELHMSRRYDALELGEAITTCRAMVDLFEDAGVRVIRVGQQAGPDGLGRAVAGPRHSSLRELVEARRVFDRLQSALATTQPGAAVTVRCAPADLSRVHGPYKQHIRSLRAACGLRSLRVTPDPNMARGTLMVDLDA